MNQKLTLEGSSKKQEKKKRRKLQNPIELDAYLSPRLNLLLQIVRKHENKKKIIHLRRTF